MTARRDVFASLGNRNYRLYFIGQAVSISGNWMQTVAQSFLVLELTDSGTALGLATAARFTPIFLLSAWGGLLADRLDKRRILFVTQALSGLFALAFAAAIWTHTITMPLVYVLALGIGTVNAFDNPTRQSFISELVPGALLGNAVLLNSITVNLSRAVGSALGGAIAAAIGLAPCFTLDAASFVAVLITLAMMRRPEIAATAPILRERGQIRAGLRYVARTPSLLVPLGMIAVIGMLAWEFQVTLPLLADNTFHGGAGTYGAMTAALGAGAVVGGFVSAFRPPRASGLSSAAIGWGLAIVMAALAPTLEVEYAVLLLVGYGSITFNSLAKTSLQLAAEPIMRGRVMALWTLAWLGSTPIGGPIVGWIGEHSGARWSLLAGGIPTVMVGLFTKSMLQRLEMKADAETIIHRNVRSRP